MNRETRSQPINRKRTRQEVNLNTTSGIQAKQTKVNNKKFAEDMATHNREFIDLSGSINARQTQNNNINDNAASTSQRLAANAPSVNKDPEVRELVRDEALVVQRALEDRVKNMVQDEISEIKRSIMELSKAVKELSVTRSQELEQSDVRQNQQMRSGINTNEPLAYNNLPANNHAETGYSPQNNESDAEAMRRNNNYQRNSEKVNIRVDKWGIVFNGNNTEMNVEDFIFRIEHLQANYDISWEEILRDFHLLVNGTARDWYWLFVKPHGYLGWPTLKNELRNQYQTNLLNFEIMRDLVERKQQPNESLDKYFFEMSKLRSRLIQPIPECDMVKILKRNIKESLARIVYPIQVTSVEQLRMECQEAERNFPRRDFRANNPQQRILKSVHEIFYGQNEDEDQDLEEIAAVRTTTQKENITCWNCKLAGHTFRDCNSAERNLFCYRCGKPNVIAPKCPECQQGNRVKGGGAAGDPRPAKPVN